MILEELATRIEAIAGIDYMRPPVSPANLFLRSLPDQPGSAMALFLTGGREPMRTMENKTIDRWRIMIWCRGLTGGEAETAMLAVYTDLLDANNVVIDTKRWLRAQPVQPPFLLERDANRRYVYSMNVEIWREGED